MEAAHAVSTAIVACCSVAAVVSIAVQTFRVLRRATNAL